MRDGSWNALVGDFLATCHVPLCPGRQLLFKNCLHFYTTIQNILLIFKINWKLFFILELSCKLYKKKNSLKKSKVFFFLISYNWLNGEFNI